MAHKVRLKRGLPDKKIRAGTEFFVDVEDDGMWSLNPSYCGWLTATDGRKYYLGFDQDDCEVVEW